MSIRSKLAAAAVAALSITGLTMAAGGPAHATTTLYIKSFEAIGNGSGGTDGNYLESGGNSGQNVYFSHSITSIAQWDFNIQSNGQYYMHPHGKSGCLTVVTTGTPYLKIEGCVGAFNQYFRDPSSGGFYHITNDGYSDKAVRDVSNGVDNGAWQAQMGGSVFNDGFGVNGITMKQSSTIP